ncbi:hypothetical protein ACJX0J_013552, partial [Zea mays]
WKWRPRARARAPSPVVAFCNLLFFATARELLWRWWCSEGAQGTIRPTASWWQQE